MPLCFSAICCSFALRLGDVDEDRRARARSPARGPACRCSRETVYGACGASAGVIRRIALPSLDVVAHVRDGGVPRLVVRRPGSR